MKVKQTKKGKVSYIKQSIAKLGEKKLNKVYQEVKKIAGVKNVGKLRKKVKKVRKNKIKRSKKSNIKEQERKREIRYC